MAQTVLLRKKCEIFCFNVCQDCLMATTVGIRTLRNNGDLVYEANLGMPLNCFMNIEDALHNPNRSVSTKLICLYLQC